MRLILAALIALIVGCAIDSAQADPYRWCAQYHGRGGGATNCYFVTLQQCEAAISGVGGYCYRNHYYTGQDGSNGRRGLRR